MAYESYSVGVPVGTMSICGFSDLYIKHLDFEEFLSFILFVSHQIIYHLHVLCCMLITKSQNTPIQFIYFPYSCVAICLCPTTI